MDSLPVYRSYALDDSAEHMVSPESIVRAVKVKKDMDTYVLEEAERKKIEQALDLEEAVDDDNEQHDSMDVDDDADDEEYVPQSDKKKKKAVDFPQFSYLAVYGEGGGLWFCKTVRRVDSQRADATGVEV